MLRDLQLSAMAIYTATQEKAKRIYGHRCDDRCQVPEVLYSEVNCNRVEFQTFDVIALSEHGIICKGGHGVTLKRSLACMTPREFLDCIR